MTLELYVNKMLRLEEELKCTRGDLLRVCQYESGNSATAVNGSTNASGLIQFMPSTLKKLGWLSGPEAFRELSEVEQVPYARRYMAPYSGRVGTLADVYLAVFSPAFLGSPDNRVLYSKDAKGYGGRVYALNANLDENGDGSITPNELAAAARRACRGERWAAIAKLAGLGSGDGLQNWGTTFWVQSKLGAVGFDPGGVDGVWGPKTEKALRAFQKYRGLVVDGIVGPITLKALT